MKTRRLIAVLTLGLGLLGSFGVADLLSPVSKLGPVLGTPATDPTAVRQTVTTYVTSAQIKALNATPITLLAARAGFMFAPRYAHVYRETGDAYTANGATAICVRFTDASGNIRLSSFDLTPLTTAGPFTVLMTGPTTNATGLAGADFSTVTSGQALVLHITGAGSPTVGTGGLYITVWYQEFPDGRMP
jgi:hypothetical protein